MQTDKQYVKQLQATKFTDILGVMCFVMDDVVNYDIPSSEAKKHLAQLFDEIHTRYMRIDAKPTRIRENRLNHLMKGVGE